MGFWIGILVGAVFVWATIGMGFYEMVAILFNIVISIYLAISLRPTLIEIIPAAGSSDYSNALMMLAIAIGAFAILHGITWVNFTGQFKVAFPKILDTIGAWALAFFAGLLVWSFASILIGATPISKDNILGEIGFNKESQQANAMRVGRWCCLVNFVIASDDNCNTTQEAILGLLEDTEKKAPAPIKKQPKKPVQVSDSNDQVSESNDVETLDDAPVNKQVEPANDVNTLTF